MACHDMASSVWAALSAGLRSVEGVDVEAVPSMQEMPVQSAIMTPAPGALLEGDVVEASGFAWSGGGRGIARVDVSADGGETWTTAALGDGAGQHPARAWAWTFWSAEIQLAPDVVAAARRQHAAAAAAAGAGAEGRGGVGAAAGAGAAEAGGGSLGPHEDPPRPTVELCVKATDASYNVQPERLAPIWNLRGLNNNAWHRVQVVIDP